LTTVKGRCEDFVKRSFDEGYNPDAEQLRKIFLLI
jgi:hypothetical protein